MTNRFGLDEIKSALEDAGILKEFRAAGSAKIEGFPQTQIDKVVSGGIFIAYQGVKFDTHQLVAKAVDRGAGLLIVDNPAFVKDAGKAACAVVTNGREAVAALAAKYYGNPERQLKFIGVTGTNGKTSTVWLIRELLAKQGVPVLSVGTLGAYLGDDKVETNHTTPDAPELFELFAEALKRGISHVCMEVSSHAVAQKKVAPLKFDALAFTSFSRDHLDFHPTMEEYFETKWELFGSRYDKPGALKLVHVDVKTWIKSSPSGVTFYGTTPDCDVKLTVESAALDGSKLKIESSSFAPLRKSPLSGVIPLVGTHNTENFCAAFVLASHILDRAIPPEDWERIQPVPGRLENASRGLGNVPQAIIDYSHTPDSLAKTLEVLRPFAKGKLWVVFGCGGDRDPGKRTIMGKVAEDKADEVVVTSDNPRTENADAIIEQIRQGFSNPHYVYPNREDAIRFAVTKAGENDIILIAGKGHEDYQIIGQLKHHFDDREVAKKYLKQKGIKS